jgi:hypothetical protein
VGRGIVSGRGTFIRIREDRGFLHRGFPDFYNEARALMRLLIVVFTLASLLSAGGPAIVRDWEKNPVVTQIDTTADLFAVGDAHSDYVHLVRALDAAGIIAGRPDQPEQVRWRAGRAVLISTGDMIDKGPRTLDVLKVYQILRAQARLAGGDVVILAGNHEAEFLADPGRERRPVRPPIKGSRHQSGRCRRLQRRCGQFPMLALVRRSR